MMVLRNQQNAIIICHEANDTKTDLPADDDNDAKDSDREKEEEKRIT